MTVPFALLAMLQSRAPGGGGLILAIQVVAILGIFYFFMVMPQQKQRKKHESALMQLKKGDEIVTAGGIIAKVVHIREGSKDGVATPTLEDAVTIQSGESRLIVERGRVARIGGTNTGAPGA